MSTFVFECDAGTWRRAGFERMGEAETLAYCEAVFADTLQGHHLVSNKSIWRNFPKVRNARWSAGNRVLIGDAQRTAHFSIGSGTRLAMEDAIALAGSLSSFREVPDALAAFEATRRPIVDKLVAAADASADWYEHFPEHMQLAPREFAWSYIQRSGRVDPERLRRIAPKFVAGA
jgi:2-polyprenyl-6-methoxyphenol hydroxylase-like FAD-dependent oxidoreductase